MALSAAGVQKARPRGRPYRMADERGLYLLVQPSGAKWWRLDYRLRDPGDPERVLRRTFSLGTFPDVGLSDARTARDAARQLVARGVDPSAARREERAPTLDTRFEAVGRAWWKSRCPGWSPTHRGRVLKRIEKDVFPTLGPKPVGDISMNDVLDVLLAVEGRGVGETVFRIKGYISDIFGRAIAAGLVAIDPTDAIDKGDFLQPKPRKRHRAALKAGDFPTFLCRLADSDEERDTVEAIRLVLWSAGRTNEIRFAHKDEFEAMDGPAPLWRLPPERMKPHGQSGVRLEHLVPLPRQAAGMLARRIAEAGPSGLLFARPTRSGTISENTMLYGLYRLGWHSRATIHGLRGSFSTIANEATRFDERGEEVRMWDSDWIERCLAHVEGDTVRGAYNAAEWIGPRRRLLQWWADWLDSQEAIGRIVG